MAIGKSKLQELFSRGKLLKELDAWYSAFNSTTKEQLVEWVQSQLFDKGVDGKGIVIGQYSYATELISKGLKKQGDNYTFKDTGSFYNSMRAEITDYLVYVTADGRKGKDNLYQKYSEYLTTLTDENTNKLKEIVREAYINYIRKILRIN